MNGGDRRIDQLRRAWLDARTHPLLPQDVRDAVDQVVMYLGELELRVATIERRGTVGKN